MMSAPHIPSSDIARDEVTAILSAADQLAKITDLYGMLRTAIEIGREVCGVERLRVCLREGATFNLRGAWGTSLRGQLCDERQLSYGCGPSEYEALRRVRAGSATWLSLPSSTHFVVVGGRRRVIGRGWTVLTPLVHAGELVGMLYNDTALTHRPIEERGQLALAILASLLADRVVLRRSVEPSHPPSASQQSEVVRRALAIIHKTATVRGTSLARELGVTSSYLARTFKAEMRVSIVEYCNRARVDHFLLLARQGRGNIRDVAFEAGFCSYAQFHRVFLRVVGMSPGKFVQQLQFEPKHEAT